MKSNLFILAIILSGCGSETTVREVPSSEEQKTIQVEVTYAPTPTPTPIPTPIPAPPAVLHFSEITPHPITYTELYQSCLDRWMSEGIHWTIPTITQMQDYLSKNQITGLDPADLRRDEVTENEVWFWANSVGDAAWIINLDGIISKIGVIHLHYGMCVYESN